MSSAAAWEAALDALEADLAAAEELADTGTGAALSDWSAPHLDPLPPELGERAIALAERQQRLLERLPGLITRTRRQLDVARKVSGTGRGPSSTRSAIYIDTTA
ncbi:hypothetical protein P5P86_18365 [Nocardioides sp. BP30]|uniref:hypothetical protein n=1 Tax=Nocardioides sp. BP30 TaxID=3036374 RepID=UPI002469BF4A|nr:hypothetical protein [Nocardioides sp. BP30]WGL51904.1 hypothetical protein P5P86_18365 [Nocardioides sp. BP30]